jgi:hypothetical protein
MKNKTSFVTFPSKELKKKRDYYLRFVNALEEQCNINIKYRWFDQKDSD